MAATIDAVLINELGIDTHIIRTPLWGLGCVGGAVGLSNALRYTKANPRGAVMLIAVEICSLAFMKDDLSKSNIIASALFSDGGASTLVVGRENSLFNSKGINLIDSYSTTYYDSLDVMGWDVVENGFKAVFSKDIPNIVSKYVRNDVIKFLSKFDLEIDDIEHFIFHPGGVKVINAYEDSLNLSKSALRYTKKVLREHGNMSSPTVLYVLKEFLDSCDYSEGDYGLISALGPGFSSELILFQVS